MRTIVLAFSLVVTSVVTVAAQPATVSQQQQAQAILRSLEGHDSFRHAHVDGDPRKAEWIKLAVSELRRQLGPRWCLNGKRGNASEPSLDVVVWLVDLTNPRKVEAWDVILGAGGESPRVQWQDITDRGPTWGDPGTAICIDPPPPPPGSMVDPTAAGMEIETAFQARFGRTLYDSEWTAIKLYARSKGWGGGLIARPLVDAIMGLVAAYSGDLSNPFPPPAPPAAFGGELTTRSPSFYLDEDRFDYCGITAFLLFYDYVLRPAQYTAFVEQMVAHGVTVPRVAIAVDVGYLSYPPKPERFGNGWTTELGPQTRSDYWPLLRSFVADLNAHGLTPELVIFGTAGPLSSHALRDFATPAGRMAFLDRAARELRPARQAFVEIANEFNFIGFSDDGKEIAALATRYKQIDPDRVLALSAPTNAWDTPANRLMASGDYATVHSSRATKPRSYQWVVDQFFLWQRTLGKRVINNEGINADSVGEYGNDADPRNHFANGVFTRLIGMDYTFHFDRSLFGLPAIDADGSLPALKAWKAGLDSVPIDPPGEFFATAGGSFLGDVPFVSAGNAYAIVGRHDNSTGYALALGTPPDFVLPSSPGWMPVLQINAVSHRLYKLTRIVH